MAEPHSPREKITKDTLLFNILPRLPVKTLLRFTCVSKQWLSFLKTPSPLFSKIHLHKVTNDHHQNHDKLLATTPYKFCTIDCETPKNGFTSSRPFPFKVGPHQDISFLTSFHGMVCVGIHMLSLDDDECLGIHMLSLDDADHYSDIILWNPVTGDYKTLSKAGSHKECYETYKGRFGLYYSSSEDDYMLLRITRNPSVYIYSLKSDSWRKVELTDQGVVHQLPCWISYRWEPSVLLNGSFYFLQHVNRRTYTHHSYSILKFNTKTEKLSWIPVPGFVNLRTTCLSFMVLRGCIHMLVNIKEYSLTIMVCFENGLWWIVGGVDWTKLGDEGPKSSLWCHEPLHLMRNGNMLMHSETGNYVYEVDMKNNTKDMCCSYGTKSMDICPGGKFMETLVSPNQYMI